jgi:hypothetical protein
MTLLRELEEELLGRDELELGGQGVADPIHPSRLSEPMRWLMDRADPATWQMECTGFGVNLLTGNYEFAALTAIHDEHWWSTYGGAVLANWEAQHLQQYSVFEEGAEGYLKGSHKLHMTERSQPPESLSRFATLV